MLVTGDSDSHPIASPNVEKCKRVCYNNINFLPSDLWGRDIPPEALSFDERRRRGFDV